MNDLTNSTLIMSCIFFKYFNSQPQKMYGFPKLHKPNKPLRSLVSAVQELTYLL